MKLFSYAVLWHPNEKQKEKGKVSLVLVEPKTVLVKDINAAQMAAATSIPETYSDELDQCELAVRPF